MNRVAAMTAGFADSHLEARAVDSRAHGLPGPPKRSLVKGIR
jgi:hypothetical protein